jgi:hypothetical protein
MLAADLSTLQRSPDWGSAEMAARALLVLDPFNFAAVKALVEASLLRLDIGEALSTIDDFLEECGDSPTVAREEAQRLRRRVSSHRRTSAPAPFIGRADTISVLASAWHSAARGDSQYIALTGPAGIGKTRVATALRELVAARGGEIFQYACGDTDRYRPLSLFARLSEKLAGMPGSLGVSPNAFSHIKRLSVPDAQVASVTPDSISSEILRAELQDALVDLFDAVTAEKPLLLLIDDAHLLDSASWAVLKAISARVQHRFAMLLLCMRSTAHIQHSVSTLPHYHVVALRRLSDSESRSLFLAISQIRENDEAKLDDSLRLAAGNPFFIQAMARHPRWTSTSSDVPLDITALAARSYHSLDECSRTVLECILILRDLSTIARVREAACVDDNALLRSLRILEEDGLAICEGHDLRCSHELLADALRNMVPSSVAAILQERLAHCLEAECIQHRFDSTLAWVAANAWLSLGHVTAAARLLRRCAAYAANLGEHSEAARILSRLLVVNLPECEAMPLLDELIAYADIGGERSIRARALRERLKLMESPSSLLLSAGSRELSEVRVASAEADLNEIGDVASVIAESRVAISDDSLDSELRMRAGVSLLIAADVALDASLGKVCWMDLNQLARKLGAHNTQALRAKLIYHTVFGDPTLAVKTARRLLRLHPIPTIDLNSVIARRNALFALQILGESRTFLPSAIAAFALMSERKVYTEAVYLAVTIAEHFIASGDLAIALDWLHRASSALLRVYETAEGVTQGYMSALSQIACLSGEYSATAELLALVHQRLRLMDTPRLRAINLATAIRLDHLRGNALPSGGDLNRLRSDYDIGRSLGRQDTVVEGLWLAYHASGASKTATDLLVDYFDKHRREDCRADWSLWKSTKSDAFWHSRESLVPMPKDGREVPTDRLRAIISLTVGLSPQAALTA